MGGRTTFHSATLKSKTPRGGECVPQIKPPTARPELAPLFANPHFTASHGRPQVWTLYFFSPTRLEMRPVTQPNSSIPISHQCLPGTTEASCLRIPCARLRKRGCAIYLSWFHFFFFIVQTQWREEQRQWGGEGGCGGKTMSWRESVKEDNKGRGGEPVRRQRQRQRQGGVQACERTREQNRVARKRNESECTSSGLKQEGADNFCVV